MENSLFDLRFLAFSQVIGWYKNAPNGMAAGAGVPFDGVFCQRPFEGWGPAGVHGIIVR